MASIGSGQTVNPDANVADMLKKLNLTSEEEQVAAFSDDEDGESNPVMEWTLVGKVLSPLTVHASAVQGAMRPAWGNPAGLKVRSIGEKGDNLFVVEFQFKQDMERALRGSPWPVGKHAVILRDYDESLKPSEICFDRMEIWAQIMDLPLGWMNKHRGERAMGLIGDVKKMDVDKDGKASVPFLRARVANEVAKPIRRGVLLKTKKDTTPEWFDIQYEKLPYYCASCGIMGHSHLECDKPLIRDDEGKLPYETHLRATDQKRKKFQSFPEAASETFGSVSSSSSKQPQRSTTSSYGRPSAERAAGLGKEMEDEVSSPLKKQKNKEKEEGLAKENASASRQLFHAGKEGARVPRKRKSKTSFGTAPVMPDLNGPATESLTMVPVGLVSSLVEQMRGAGGALIPSLRLRMS
jgi:hypothetical protein